MKRVLLALAFVFLSIVSISQVLYLDAAKLEVRADNGDLIASNYFTGMVNAVCGHETIAMWYDNDRVEIRNLKLDLLTSNYYTGIVGLAIIAKTIVNKNQKIEPLIILYYKDRKVETRDKQLNLISTRYS